MNSCRFYGVLVIFLIGGSGQSQNYLENYVDTYAIRGKIWEADKSVAGHPLFLEEWSKGGINLIPAQYITDVLLAFDIESNTLLYQSKDGKVFTVQKNKVSSFYLFDSTGDSIRFLNVGFHGFLELLYNGSSFLLKKHVKSIKKGEKYDGYNSTYAQDRYILTTSLLIIKDQESFEISSKKQFFEIWNNSDEMLAYIKKNKLKHNDESDLINALGFYDEILSHK